MHISKHVILRLCLLFFIVVALAVVYGFGLTQYLTLDFFQQLYSENAFLAATIFFVIYIAITALSLPIAVLMTLFGGAIFGLVEGTILISFASSIGATLSMLASRLLLRNWVQNRFGSYLTTINEGVAKDGAFYLFSLRLIPAIPFSAINLIMGLMPIKTWTYYWVSQLGMLVGTVVYVNAGVQLGSIDELSVSGIATPELIMSFLLLAIFPWFAKAVVKQIQTRKLYKNFVKPKHFDVNLAVIGAGSGGLVSAYIAAAVKAKVTLFEKHQMGGDCLNTGCVPSKTLIRSARLNHDIKQADRFGISTSQTTVDFHAVMARVQQVIKQIEPNDSVERYTELGVECVQGEAQLLSPWEIKIGDQILTSRNIIIATGAHPFIPDIPGLAEVNAFTSDTIWEIKEKPERLLVLGGGPIGSELAQAFHQLDIQVTILDRTGRLLPREDEDVAELVMQQFRDEGIEILCGHEIVAFHRDGERQWLEAVCEGKPIEINFDAVLIAFGRKANSTSLSDTVHLETTPQGTLAVNEYLQTNYPNIYACGDVAGPYQFTHVASHQAWYATVNALFGRLRKFKVDYSVIPWATFVEPEVARVGLNEQEAQQKGIAYEVTRCDLEHIDRALADGNSSGFIKVLTVPGKDTILGCTIVGAHAGELIIEYITAMKYKLGLNKILGTIHIYPTQAELNKRVAGEWKRNHAPVKLLGYVQKFHNWQRNTKDRS